MDSQILELIQSFQSRTKVSKLRYNEFLAHVYSTFDKKISMCRKDSIVNKYKKMKIDILNYIIANEKEIIFNLSK